MMQYAQVPTLEMHQALIGRVQKLERTSGGSFGQASQPAYLTRSQAATALNCSISTLDRLIAKGKLKTRREGARNGKVMVEVESIGIHLASTGTSRDYIETSLKDAYYGN